MSGGGVQCWGYNNDGEVGNGTAGANTATPGPVSGISSGATAVATGGNFSCALLTGGTVSCWGNNGIGQLGNGSTTNSSVPVQVSGLSGATAIATGSSHACAIQSNGSIVCWGSNAYGELGNGSSTGPQACVSGSTSNVCSTTPVQVQGITNAIAIGAGQNITCALLSNNTMDCWGLGANATIGISSSQSSATPVSVSGLSGVTSIAVGSGTVCALLSGGTVDCWGSDYYAQLGNGTANEVVASPAPVMKLSGAVAISAGYVSVCALLSNGTVDCWGTNGDGEIGTGSTTGPETCSSASGTFSCANVATPVSVVSGATAITTGSNGSCALLSTGNADCWGYGGSGTLGNNSFTSSVPTPGPVVW
jgi:alpha-tubulin suppressor-like RCC1 family protein